MLGPTGEACLTGETDSGDFPLTPDAYCLTYPGTYQAFMTCLNASGTDLVYSTFVGGTLGDWGSGIAIDSAGAMYVAGATTATDFPTTPGAFDRTLGGTWDAFVLKLVLHMQVRAYMPLIGRDQAMVSR